MDYHGFSLRREVNEFASPDLSNAEIHHPARAAILGESKLLSLTRLLFLFHSLTHSLTHTLSLSDLTFIQLLFLHVLSCSHAY